MLLVRIADLFPINDRPELAQPGLLAPHAVPRAHPRMLVHGHAEQGEQRLPHVQEVGLVQRAVRRRVERDGRVDVVRDGEVEPVVRRRAAGVQRARLEAELAGRVGVPCNAGRGGRRGHAADAGQRGRGHVRGGVARAVLAEHWVRRVVVHVAARHDEQRRGPERGQDAEVTAGVGDEPDPAAREEAHRRGGEGRLQAGDVAVALLDLVV